MSDTTTTLTAVAPGAYAAQLKINGQVQTYPVVALTSLTTDHEVITEPVVISAAGRLATPSELRCDTWTMRLAGGGAR